MKTCTEGGAAALTPLAPLGPLASSRGDLGATKPSILDLGALEHLCRQHKIDPEWIRRFRNGLLKQGLSWSEALQRLPGALREIWGANLHWQGLTPQARMDSKIDGASKVLWEDGQKRRFESVIMRIQSGRNTVCVSSQFGCAVGCRFCATAQSRIGQSLAASAILEQVLYARQLLKTEGRSLRNVVFMGMGEPLLNFDALSRALQTLCDPKHFALAARHILVSTVGIPQAMVEFAARFPQIPLALSLHAAIPSRRIALMPIARRYSLTDLSEAVKHCNRIQEHPLMIEYLMLAGHNDSDADLRALVDFCRPLRVRVNLIPYNEVEGLSFRGSPEERIASFHRVLQEEGLEVTRRRSLGSDIEAACGQLLRRENRLRTLGRKSAPSSSS